MKLNQCEQIQGFFLSFTDEERDKIFSMLDEEEYPLDSDGIKKFLLDNCEPSEEEFDVRDVRETATDRVMEKANEYIKNHPELLMQATSLASNIGRAISKKLKKADKS